MEGRYWGYLLACAFLGAHSKKYIIIVWPGTNTIRKGVTIVNACRGCISRARIGIVSQPTWRIPVILCRVFPGETSPHLCFAYLTDTKNVRRKLAKDFSRLCVCLTFQELTITNLFPGMDYVLRAVQLPTSANVIVSMNFTTDECFITCPGTPMLCSLPIHGLRISRANSWG